MDTSKISPAPWEPDFTDGGIDGILRMVPHGNINTLQKTGEQFSHADLEFISLARNAFDVMMRREWGVQSISAGLGCGPQGWEVINVDGKTSVSENFYPDPYTALVETDKWYRENAEGK